ncbi:MAG: M20/M25/M40 family metallo-hydrolase, partial [Candidatus Latescibacteria bacterium]|nr:M20/M25/M40 family metallo-hydrolase [Candidatus Latescibacterota bacterium]
AKPYNNAKTNLRSRYARRSTTFEMTRYIRDQLAQILGEDAVEIVPFQHTPDDSTMYNVVGTLRGTDPDAGYYAITGHYDAIALRTRGWNWQTDPAPGADDNATGSVAVIEAARVLSNLRLPWTITFIAFSGEELGLWGSRAYATEAVDRGDRILGVINLDMIAYNNRFDRLHIVSSPGSAWLARLMEEANRAYDIGLRIDLLIDATAKRSDHASFWDRGYDAVLVIEGYPPERDYPDHPDSTNKVYRANAQIHTVDDVADSLNLSMFQKGTQLVVATLAQFVELEPILPDLAIFPGDLRFSKETNDLMVTITNVGRSPAPGGYRVVVSACSDDSTNCRKILDEPVTTVIPAGGASTFHAPWNKLGNVVFSAIVDPDTTLAEQSRENNTHYEHLRAVSRTGIAIYPNPVRLDNGKRYLTFSGLPRNSTVKIFTSSGELIWSGDEGREELREVIWRGINTKGFLVGSGVYVYEIVLSDGHTERVGKIAVVR